MKRMISLLMGIALFAMPLTALCEDEILIEPYEEQEQDLEVDLYIEDDLDMVEEGMQEIETDLDLEDAFELGIAAENNLITEEPVGETVQNGAAMAESSAYDRILVYDQMGGGWKSWKLNDGATGDNNMERDGCHIFAYAHAVQWLTRNKLSYENRASLIEELIGVCDIPWGPTDYNDTNPQVLYNAHVVSKYGAVEKTVPGSGAAMEELFNQGGVVIANPGGHYHIAVGAAYDDLDGNGSSEYYIHVVDSSCQSTWWRANQNFGAALYDFSTRGPIQGYQKSGDKYINGTVNGVTTSKWGGGEYWVPYSVFSRFRLDRAYVPGEGSIPAKPEFEIDENGVLIGYNGPGGDVVIPDGVTAIGNGEQVFAYRGVTSVTIPESVISIGDAAFCDCDLETVTIPDSVTTIGDRAFYLCESLKSLKIGKHVTSIGEDAFRQCYQMSTVTIPASVTSIGYKAFGECDSLKEIVVNKQNKKYAAVDGVLYDYSKKTLLCCPGAKPSIAIPDSVTAIEAGAFDFCSELESVTIPNSVLRIGRGAFEYCDNMVSVKISDSVTRIEEFTFNDCHSLTSVTIPDRVTSIGERAFQQCLDLKDVFIPASVKEIGELAFYKQGDDGEELAAITIHGYAGSYAELYAKKEGFEFEPISAAASVAGAKITVKNQVYTGKALKPTVKVVLGKKTLKKGTDYTVTYKNNKAIGTATVTVKGKGNYTGKASAAFKIKPRTVKGLKLTAGKGKLTASWKKDASVGGYQLQYSLKKDFSNAKKATVKKAATIKATLKSLVKGKTYYVRVRAYKKVGGKTYYSAWSSAKKAKVK